MGARRLLGQAGFGGGAAMAIALMAPAMGLGAVKPAAVQVGDFNRSPEIEFNAFFPRHITVAQNSSIKFTVFGFHTVTFPAKGKKAPPFIVPSAPNPVTNSPAGTPYWWSGVTPQLGLNPAVPAPSGGTKVTGAKLVSSGFLPDKKPVFTVSFPKTGTFKVQCLVHPNMKGTVTVVAKGSPRITTAAKAKAGAKREKKAQRARVNRAIAKARATQGNTVIISPGNKQAQAFAFYPAAKTVSAGSQVTFKMSGGNEVHTVSFGPAAFLTAVAKKTFEGTGLALDAEGAYPSDPPAAGPPAVTPTANGNGYVNSGILTDPGFPGANPHRFTFTFPQPGVYAYQCLVHPEMRGTITVN